MEITHNTSAHRFCTTADGFTGYVEYQIAAGRLDILHTVVPKEIGGRGIAAALVKAAYAWGHENGLEPAATCSYAARWLEKNG